MRKLMCLCLVLMVAAASQSIFAADAFVESILNSVKMNTKFGPQVNTFEDVEPITDIRANYVGDGPITGQGEISSKFQGFAKKNTVDEFFARLSACGGLIFSEGNLNFVSFLATKFYLDSGHMQNDEDTGTQVWKDDKLWPNG
ncbi:MAG TPA: hypothetical protein DCG57_05560, partial [Candidatus Riflebacteria bacterium]|nr:hypothetical protein [Candidatus Riflebacteria bacterium]